MNIEEINKLTKQDMNKVNTKIYQQIKSKSKIINKLSLYIFNNKGKQIRPIVAILIAKALKYKKNQHIIIAALIEFIHTATLLHDDVIDKSETRRGKITSNIKFGNAASILIGDYIYTRAFQMMITLKSIKILSLISNAVNVIAEGEITQLMNCKNPHISIKNYMEVIYKKTAQLFEVASHTSAIIAGANPKEERALKNYGKHLGIAFQLIDDLLDYSYDSKILGKNTGKDLEEGKTTLPLLHAMYNSYPTQKLLIENIIKKQNKEYSLQIVIEIMNQCGSIEYTKKYAEKAAKKAIENLKILPLSPYRKALESIANLIIKKPVKIFFNK